MKCSVIIAFLLCLVLPAFGQARAPLTDHPLISPYEGSVIHDKDVREFDEYSAFTGMHESGKEPTGLALVG